MIHILTLSFRIKSGLQYESYDDSSDDDTYLLLSQKQYEYIELKNYGYMSLYYLKIACTI